MTRVNLVLLLAVLASAIYLVSVQYDSRRLFTELDKVNAEALKLETEHDRLQVEKRAQATPGRVEKIAREKLQMHQASPAITAYVNYSAPAAQTAPALQPASAPAPAPASASASTQGGKP